MTLPSLRSLLGMLHPLRHPVRAGLALLVAALVMVEVGRRLDNVSIPWLPVRVGKVTCTRPGSSSGGFTGTNIFRLMWVPGTVVVDSDGTPRGKAIARLVAKDLQARFGASRKVEVLEQGQGKSPRVVEAVAPPVYIRIHLRQAETTCDLTFTRQKLHSVARCEFLMLAQQPQSNLSDHLMPAMSAAAVDIKSEVEVENKGIATPPALEVLTIPEHSAHIAGEIYQRLSNPKGVDYATVPSPETVKALHSLIPAYSPAGDAEEALKPFAPVLRGAGPTVLMPNLTRWSIQTHRPPNDVLRDMERDLETRGYSVSSRLRTGSEGISELTAYKGMCRLRLVEVQPQIGERPFLAPNEATRFDVVYIEGLTREQIIAALKEAPDAPAELFYQYKLREVPDMLHTLEGKATPEVMAMIREGLRLCRAGEQAAGLEKLQIAYDTCYLYMDSDDYALCFAFIQDKYKLTSPHTSLAFPEAARRVGLREIQPGTPTDLGSAPAPGKTIVFMVTPRITRGKEKHNSAEVIANRFSFEVGKSARNQLQIYSCTEYGTSGQGNWLKPGKPFPFLLDSSKTEPGAEGEITLSDDGKTYRITITGGATRPASAVGP